MQGDDTRVRAEPWRCPNRVCSGDVLLVAPAAGSSTTWSITCPNGSRWWVASGEPVCPLCGATLWDAGAATAGAAEQDERSFVGPVFDFIRGLAA